MTAAIVLDKLSKKLQDKGLSPKELAQLAQQLQALHDRLERLMNLRDLENQLQRELQLGNLTPEQMKEMLEREMDDFQDLQDLADVLKGRSNSARCLPSGRSRTIGTFRAAGAANQFMFTGLISRCPARIGSEHSIGVRCLACGSIVSVDP